MLKKEIKEFKSIVYIPAGEERIQRAYEKHLHEFREHFNKIGISYNIKIGLYINSTNCRFGDCPQ